MPRNRPFSLIIQIIKLIERHQFKHVPIIVFGPLNQRIQCLWQGTEVRVLAYLRLGDNKNERCGSRAAAELICGRDQ